MSSGSYDRNCYFQNNEARELVRSPRLKSPFMHKTGKATKNATFWKVQLWVLESFLLLRVELDAPRGLNNMHTIHENYNI